MSKLSTLLFITLIVMASSAPASFLDSTSASTSSLAWEVFGTSSAKNCHKHVGESGCYRDFRKYSCYWDTNEETCKKLDSCQAMKHISKDYCEWWYCTWNDYTNTCGTYENFLYTYYCKEWGSYCQSVQN